MSFKAIVRFCGLLDLLFFASPNMVIGLSTSFFGFSG